MEPAKNEEEIGFTESEIRLPINIDKISTK
jgi:hypothetical protein